MLKIFTLAAVAAIAPLSQKISTHDLVGRSEQSNSAISLHFKNTDAVKFWEPKKKTTEAWSQNWMSSAQENIRKSEYHFKWEEKYSAFCTPNRKNNLRFFYNDKGFTVEPRTTEIPIGEYDPAKRPEEIKYKSIPNWKVKFNLDKDQVGKGSWVVAENKAEYITDKITVQYINNDEGMRQNFIVHAPLSKSNTLKINFSIKTKLRAYLHGNQLQFYHKKTNVLNYDQLKVWDANGKPLEASIHLRSNYGGHVPPSSKTSEDKKKRKRNKFYIRVNTKNAVYPITIDPISTIPSVLLESNQTNAYMGYSVASAGDVNGDGYSDVIVGAYLYLNPSPFEVGAAFIFHGSSTGITTTIQAQLKCNQTTQSDFGLAVSGAGDVNGDGYSDVIVGARNYTNGQSQEGAAFVFLGSAGGIITTIQAQLEVNQSLASMGQSVACAGDVNGDGYSDVIVGAPLFNTSGGAFIYHGSTTGIIPTIQTQLELTQPFGATGSSVASAGDVNGDGYSDVIVGDVQFSNPDGFEGGAFIYHGSATGIVTTIQTQLEGNQFAAFMGRSVACAGDVNGDGYSDVIVGADDYDNGQSNEGAAFVFHGSASGITTTIQTQLEVNQIEAGLGRWVACAGDVNGDGYSDVVVGAYQYDNGQSNEGAAFVYHGSPTGINTSIQTQLESNQIDAEFGNSVASAGDVNGDGYSDVIVGAPNYDNGNPNEGAAFVYHGSTAGLSATPNSTLDDADQIAAYFGTSVSSAGDVNGDGYSDVIIGAYLFTDGANTSEGRAFVYYGSAAGLPATPSNTPDDANQAFAQFGISVACAGDVNGDGYSDVIIGAYRYDDGGNTDEGRAFVYYGSAAGLSATPNNTPDDADQADAHFGVSVASAGDVNGDGYSDVIIGARLYNDGAYPDEGRAFVYHGSAAGLSATPNSTPDDADQPGASFGYSVASAGDVNGDGYSDVIIGAYNYSDGGNPGEGRAFVYHGSSSGLPATPNNTPDDADQAVAFFGFSVASAGDVNGDGYCDVIIGAKYYDDGANSDEGRAFVYHGSSTGLSATPNSTPDDCNQALAEFGFSVASAGDVNGDGYGDVIIGAHYYNDGANNFEGRAFVYHGSATGLSASPNSTPDDANQADSGFGYSVASAGDINGDGYSDVIIGADHFHDGGNSWEGRAFLYNGNDSTSNKRNNLRLYNSDLITPINDNNFVIGNYGAGLFAKSFLGKAKAKMVWETRINYNAYSGNPITNSTLFTAQQSAYTDLGLTGAELKDVITKLLGSGIYTKLRARVKYDPVTAITGQVYGPWRNVSAVIDGNSLGALPIELISFDAAWLQKGKTAKINFTTGKESGICCFDIEKSPDGFTFYTIGSLQARNAPGVQSYSFIDNYASGKKQFYRLKIKGNTGKAEYSNILLLQNNGATEILVFPNPTTDVLQLQLNGAYDKMNVQVVNASGQVVKRLNGLSASGQVVTIPVHHLPAGQYWLHLQSGTDKQVLQFVKQ